MLGRYAINSASRPRPSAASLKAATVVGRFDGCTNPRVSSDEPLSVNATGQLSTPRPWKTNVYPANTSTSQTSGSTSNDTGAYSAITRSRPSYVFTGRAISWNTFRTATHTT